MKNNNFRYLIMIAFLSTKLVIGEVKYGLRKVTADNFKSLIIDGSGPEVWVVGVKGVQNVSIEKWMELEFKLRGLMVRVGLIDPNTDGAFMKRKGFQDKSKKYPLARIYPYGGWKVKANDAFDVHKWSKIRKAAVASVPDDTTRVVDMKDLEYFVHSSYQRSPPRFPVLLFTDKRSTSALYKALALKYSTYFNFGVMRKPSREFRQKFNIKKLPAILVMISTILPNKHLTFSGVPYEVNIYGAVSYLTVAKFLYSVHELHWENLPMVKKFRGEMNLKDEYLAEVKTILVMPEYDGEIVEEAPKPEGVHPPVTEITYSNHRDMCGDKAVGVCLIVFLDGSDQQAVQGALRVLRDVQGVPSIEGKPLQYLWVNTTCHPEYGEVFGISPEALPTLLLAKPRHRLFTTTTDLSAKSISNRVSNILLGRAELARYSRFNDMHSTNCQDDGGMAKKGKSSKRSSDEL